MRVLYFCQRNQKNYLQTKEPVTCDCCGKELKLMDCVIVHSSFTKKNAIPRRYTCFDEKCINKFRSELVSSYLPAFIVEDVPFGCNIVPDVNIEIGAGNGTATVFSTAISNEGLASDCSSCQTIDRTQLAGRESLEGAQISYTDPLHLKEDVKLKDVLLVMNPPDTKLGTADDVMEILADIASMQLEGPQAKKQLGQDKTTEE